MSRTRPNSRRDFSLRAYGDSGRSSSSRSQLQTEPSSKPSGEEELQRLRLVPRDRELLSFIGTGGLANLSQLQRLFWPSSRSERTCRHRLSLLEKAGFIESGFIDGLKPGELVFTLTRKAGRALFSEAERTYLYTSLPPRLELMQQLLGQEARVRLSLELPQQGKRLVGWKNEHQLRGEAWQKLGGFFYQKSHLLPEIADAQALISEEGSEEISALDLEIDGYYFGKLLRGKLAELAKKEQTTLWVTTSERRVAQIKELSQEITPTRNQLQFLVVARSGS